MTKVLFASLWCYIVFYSVNFSVSKAQVISFNWEKEAEKTKWGCPAADQILSNLLSEVSIINFILLDNPIGETPPMEYPVIFFTSSALGLLTVPLTPKTLDINSILHFLSPAIKVTTGISLLSLLIKTIET